VKYRALKPYSAPPFLLAHPPQDTQVVTIPLPGFRQARNYTCGFATVLMILRHFEKEVSGQEVFEALGTARDGTGQSAIVRVLRAQGVRANIRYDADFACLASSIDAGKVMVGYLDDEEHWLVIYGYGLEPRRVFVADPEPGKTCEHLWDGYGERLQGFAIVCSAAPAESARVLPGQLSFEFGESR
jgi:ABC-type bacteriocin/lantibiotic exporter with double-glycine peptidase domain